LLALVLVPHSIEGVRLLNLGAVGAAIAALASTALAVWLYARPSGAWPGHRFSPRIWRHIVAAIVAGAVVWLLPAPSRVVSLAAVSLAALAVYAVVLVVLRELRRDDWESLRALLRRTEQEAQGEAMP